MDGREPVRRNSLAERHKTPTNGEPPLPEISNNLRAKKHLGQHFLIDGRVIDRIIGSVAPRPDETILEIGAGLGALTSRLVDRVARLVAVEVDHDLSAVLKDYFGDRKNFTLIENSALTLDFSEVILPALSARVVANLPYYISTPILQRLMGQRAYITEMYLMLQREVVNRIRAAPASSERGYLSVLVQAHCETEVLFEVPPNSFRPVPKVWSAVLRLNFKYLPVQTDVGISWDLVSAGFMQRRKTLMNNFRAAPKPIAELIENAGGAGRILERSGIDGRRRAETLTLDEWLRVSNTVID